MEMTQITSTCSERGQTQDVSRSALTHGELVWFSRFACQIRPSKDLTQSACLYKCPLDESRLCLLRVAQVRCDLIWLFPRASSFQSVVVFHFMFRKSQRFFSFCQSESSYIHSLQKGSSQTWGVSFKGLFGRKTTLFYGSDIVSYPNQSRIDVLTLILKKENHS